MFTVKNQSRQNQTKFQPCLISSSGLADLLSDSESASRSPSELQRQIGIPATASIQLLLKHIKHMLWNYGSRANCQKPNELIEIGTTSHSRSSLGHTANKQKPNVNPLCTKQKQDCNANVLQQMPHFWWLLHFVWKVLQMAFASSGLNFSVGFETWNLKQQLRSDGVFCSILLCCMQVVCQLPLTQPSFLTSRTMEYDAGNGTSWGRSAAGSQGSPRAQIC